MIESQIEMKHLPTPHLPPFLSWSELYRDGKYLHFMGARAESRAEQLIVINILDVEIVLDPAK